MPTPALTDSQLREAADTLARFNGNRTEAANALGLSYGAFRNRIVKAQAKEIPLPTTRLSFLKKRLYEEVHPLYESPVRSSGEDKSVILIGDAHDAPEIPKDRFYHMGKYIEAERPDQIVQIGDIASMDSLSRHTGNETLAGKGKHPFQFDMESLHEALSAFDEGLGDAKGIPRHITLGNHEARIWLYENGAPEVFGMMRDELYKLLAGHNWTWSTFGHYWDFAGVLFTHIPLSIMGRPLGGKNVCNTIGRDSIKDTCFGHTHRSNMHTEPKLGGFRVRTVEAGCALPNAFVEPYAKHSMSGWDWGITKLIIRDGRIEGYKWISMAELERRYG